MNLFEKFNHYQTIQRSGYCIDKKTGIKRRITIYEKGYIDGFLKACSENKEYRNNIIGLGKVKSFTNNSKYEEINRKKDIMDGMEIL